jgi:hypothetical protein
MLGILNDDVALRPAREDDLPMLEELTQDPEKSGEFEWFGWSDVRQWRRGWDENGLISPDGGTLIVAQLRLIPSAATLSWTCADPVCA